MSDHTNEPSVEENLETTSDTVAAIEESTQETVAPVVTGPEAAQESDVADLAASGAPVLGDIEPVPAELAAEAIREELPGTDGAVEDQLVASEPGAGPAHAAVNGVDAGDTFYSDVDGSAAEAAQSSESASVDSGSAGDPSAESAGTTGFEAGTDEAMTVESLVSDSSEGGAAVTTSAEGGNVPEGDAPMVAVAEESAIVDSAPERAAETVAPAEESAAVDSAPEGVEETAVAVEESGTVENVVTEDSEGAAEDEAGPDGEAKRRRRGKKGGRKGRRLDSFQVGEEIPGTVRSVQPYGAFVDVGAERDGLVHISELRDGFVEKVEDVVKEGDKVTVRIKEVDVEKGRLSLTMRSQEVVAEERQRDADKDKKTRLKDLSEGQEVSGKVTSIMDFGAFVDIGATTDGLIHISEMSEERVNRVTDILQVGNDVTVRILSIDKKRNRISLSMKAPADPEEFTYEQEETEELPSMMELAFAKARERDKKSKRGGKKSDNRQDEVIDDIIARTLGQRQD